MKYVNNVKFHHERTRAPCGKKTPYPEEGRDTEERNNRNAELVVLV
jgi:hypothetical protein